MHQWKKIPLEGPSYVLTALQLTLCLRGLRCYRAISEPGGIPCTFPFFSQIWLFWSTVPALHFPCLLLECSGVTVQPWG